ncbi:permease prefix domain 1-containing protein [uncultured Microbacterium sp.]|uniref:permease prefix domain 1-containing protein n=1 Tax=uncultured Microbacterium sp. TaxID=191216 RepID=UPI0028D8768A|nr:permease prefix domain 1-containing protein [uncultured Microbacterium sp.]
MSTDIHRLLDDAFVGVEMTPDVQDLKEEIRANLIARTCELEASGRTSRDAAAQAIAELGDVRVLLDGVTSSGPSGAPAESQHAAFLRHHVRPKTGFVVRVVIWSLMATLGIVLATLGATGVLRSSAAALIGLVALASAGLGLIVGDSLSQETTTHHPMPSRRAGGYALATVLAAAGLGVAGLVALTALPMWCIVFSALGVIAAIVLFAFLAASQTNRTKAWVRANGGAGEVPNRFEEEPETAARFGIYTAVIWALTFAVVVVLIFTVGWWWSPLALIGGFAVMMLVLARMMFGPRRTP